MDNPYEWLVKTWEMNVPPRDADDEVKHNWAVNLLSAYEKKNIYEAGYKAGFKNAVIQEKR